MPLDPSVLLKVQYPSYPDPVEDYKGFLSLRQMMDLGKLRQVQLQQEQLQNQQIQRKAQWDQEDRQRAEAVRNLFAQNPDIGFQDIAKFDPALAFKLSTDRRLMEKAKSEAAGAKLKQEREQGQSLADMVAGIRLLPKDQQQAAWDTAWGGIPVDAPPSEPEAQALYAQEYGAKAQQALGEAKEEAGRKAALYPYQVQKAVAEANKAVQESTGTQPLSTYQQRVLENQETPDNLTKLEIALQNPKLSPEKRAQLQAARPFLIELEKQKHAGTGNPDEEATIAEAIMRGEAPPDIKGMYGKGPGVRAYLASKGYNLAQAQLDWQGTQKHLATLNGPQQERLRQAITFTSDSLDNIEQLYNRWKQLGGASGYRLLNRGTLAASKQLPGEMGKTAQLLEAQINDLTSELATVYKGGNSSTDEGLRLAAENLKGEWNEQTFRGGINQIRQNLTIRKNSMLNSQPAGVSANSPYSPSAPATAPSGASGGGVVLWERGPDGKPRKVTK